MTRDEELAQAHKLFLGYSGSHTYMGRDGVLEEFHRFDVPKALEAEWLESLTADHLGRLEEPGNWSVLSFLTHHGMLDHLGAIVAAGPRGVWWERCSYWELLVTYIERINRGQPDAELAALCDRIVTEARLLEESQPADQPAGRSARLANNAEALARRLRSSTPPPG